MGYKLSLIPLFIAIICIILLLNFYYSFSWCNKLLRSKYDDRHNGSTNEITSDKKYVLFVDELNWDNDNENNNIDTVTETIACSQSCIITTNHSLLNEASKFDAILYYIDPTIAITYDLKRNAQSLHQKYIFAIREPPQYTLRKSFSRLDTFFNWTMSYRLDSDILWPYGKIIDLQSNISVAPVSEPTWIKFEEMFFNEYYFNLTTNKTKLAAWFVSECEAGSKREVLVAELKKYLEVDVYGECGSLNCTTDKCNAMLQTDYKFYFAFEKSISADYVTDLYSTMKYEVVPVLFGLADYSNFAPTNSYINANDFETAKDLANYLLYLDKNPKDYIKYFWWREHYKSIIISESQLDNYCDACTKLTGDEKDTESTTASDIRFWWFYGNRDKITIEF